MGRAKKGITMQRREVASGTFPLEMICSMGWTQPERAGPWQLLATTESSMDTADFHGRWVIFGFRHPLKRAIASSHFGNRPTEIRTLNSCRLASATISKCQGKAQPSSSQQNGRELSSSPQESLGVLYVENLGPQPPSQKQEAAWTSVKLQWS